MASPSIFSMRVVRCPSCGARLPVQAHLAMLRCEYCDARVEIERAPQQHPPQQPQAPRMPGPPVHVARPQYSRFALIVLLLPVLMAGAGAFTAFRAAQFTGTTTSTAVVPSTPVATPRALTPVARPPTPPVASVHTPTPTPPPTPAHTTTTKPRASSEPKPADGPVIDVEQARKQLEPKVRACMQTAKVHHVLAYMGNAKVGPVAVLPDSRTSVDGKKTALGKTALGRCFDAAGKSVRTSAFKSNYVRLDVRNDGVPDPLGALPSKPNPSAVREVIASFDDEVKACARKHGAEGSKASLQLDIAGPTGQLVSLRGGDLPRAFMKCAGSVYARASFAKVQPASYQVSYSISL